MKRLMFNLKYTLSLTLWFVAVSSAAMEPSTSYTNKNFLEDFRSIHRNNILSQLNTLGAERGAIGSLNLKNLKFIFASETIEWDSENTVLQFILLFQLYAIEKLKLKQEDVLGLLDKYVDFSGMGKFFLRYIAPSMLKELKIADPDSFIKQRIDKKPNFSRKYRRDKSVALETTFINDKKNYGKYILDFGNFNKAELENHYGSLIYAGGYSFVLFLKFDPTKPRWQCFVRCAGPNMPKGKYDPSEDKAFGSYLVVNVQMRVKTEGGLKQFLGPQIWVIDDGGTSVGGCLCDDPNRASEFIVDNKVTIWAKVTPLEESDIEELYCNQLEYVIRNLRNLSKALRLVVEDREDPINRS